MFEKYYSNVVVWRYHDCIIHYCNHSICVRLVDFNADGSDTNCYNPHLTTLQLDHTHLARPAQDNQHSKCDVLGLKILAHLGYDQNKAITHFQQYAYGNQSVFGEMNHNDLVNRTRVTREVIPTTFANGSDMPIGYSASNLAPLFRFTQRFYPQSTFQSDIETAYPVQEGNCRMPSEAGLRAGAEQRAIINRLRTRPQASP